MLSILGVIKRGVHMLGKVTATYPLDMTSVGLPLPRWGLARNSAVRFSSPTLPLRLHEPWIQLRQRIRLGGEAILRSTRRSRHDRWSSAATLYTRESQSKKRKLRTPEIWRHFRPPPRDEEIHQSSQRLWYCQCCYNPPWRTVSITSAKRHHVIIIEEDERPAKKAL
ncbi:hypothetical protein IF2G_10824 [Cordyceps javanica]|nr:hypothetical protein IF2G_10824 [Cordyceps javanica]